MLLLILNKEDFHFKVFIFFSDYLVNRKTYYLLNSFSSPFFNADVGIDQGSILSLILSVLFIAPIFYIFKKRINNLKIPVLFLLFVDDGLFISQEKSFNKMNAHLFCSYNIISSLLEQFKLIIEYKKTEVFHFSILHGLFNPSLLDFSYIGGSILCPKDS